jgi:HK97 gp10 family phage protein
MSLGARAQFVPRNGLGQFIPAVITPAVIASVKAGCEVIQQTAQQYCPVETGALRDSIGITITETGKTVVGVVAPTMYYASYVEYGTGRRGGPAPYPHVMTWPGQDPQPYMRPAFDENQDSIKDLFRGQLAQAFQP